MCRDVSATIYRDVSILGLPTFNVQQFLLVVYRTQRVKVAEKVPILGGLYFVGATPRANPGISPTSTRTPWPQLWN